MRLFVSHFLFILIYHCSYLHITVHINSSPYYSHCIKNMVFIKDFFSKCDQIRSSLQIWSHLRKKSLIENFIFLCSECLWNKERIMYITWKYSSYSSYCKSLYSRKYLTPFQPMFHFYTPWNIRKPLVLWYFQGVYKLKMVQHTTILVIVCNLENLDQVENNNYNQLDGYIMANDSPNSRNVSKVKFI